MEVRRTGRPGWQSPTILVTGAAILVGAVLIAFVVLSQGGGSGSSGTGLPAGLVRPETMTPTDLADGTTLGKPDAPVTVEIYADFQCPVCGKFTKDDFPRLVREFVETGMARIVTHDIEVVDRNGSTESVDAAAAAACAADQGKYWPFHDWLFANQQGENEGGFRKERLDAIATQVGLDRAKYDACVAGDAKRTAVRGATQAGLAKGITGTPTFIVNGKTTVGIPQYDQFAALIRQLAASPAPSGASPAPSGASPSP